MSSRDLLSFDNFRREGIIGDSVSERDKGFGRRGEGTLRAAVRLEAAKVSACLSFPQARTSSSSARRRPSPRHPVHHPGGAWALEWSYSTTAACCHGRRAPSNLRRQSMVAWRLRSGVGCSTAKPGTTHVLSDPGNLGVFGSVFAGASLRI